MGVFCTLAGGGGVAAVALATSDSCDTFQMENASAHATNAAAAINIQKRDAGGGGTAPLTS